jgi:ABC-type transport system involved in cytochrome c biogenesis permease subunit
MKTKTKKIKPILFILFLVTVIPTIYVYFEHGYVEHEAYNEAKTETKKIKTFSEALLFYGIGVGYIIIAILMFVKPQNAIPYLVVIVGTVAVVILYYFRIYGIPIPGTEIVITDLSSDWRDVVTKICQQIILVPVSMLFILNTSSHRNNTSMTGTT